MRNRLYRSRDDRMLFGVAGGMARYLNLDPAIVRLVWVLLFLAVGAGVLLYIAAAIVVPEEPAGYTPPSSGGAAAAGLAGSGVASGGQGSPAGAGGPQRGGRDNGGGAILLGLVLVIVGGWFLLGRFIDIDGRLVWPAILVILGLVLVLGAMRGSRRGDRG